MNRNIFLVAIVIFLFYFLPTKLIAQEFSIAIGADTTFGYGGAFDGTRYLYVIGGDLSGKDNLSIQFLTEGGAISGPRISIGQKGSRALVAFDGTNYLMVWTDPYPMFLGGDFYAVGNVYGQFIRTDGTLLGNTFTIVTDVNVKFSQGRGAFAFDGSTYKLLYCKGGEHLDHLYCQVIDKSGNLVGSPLQVSNNYAREVSLAFDGTNYLMAWCEGSGIDEYIYGQFVSSTGALVGSNFIIDDSPNKSDNPTNMAYDGTRFFVLFPDQSASDERWNLYAKFVSPNGIVSPERILICDSTKNPIAPTIASDGNGYLINWIEFAGGNRVTGRYFNKAGVPLNDPFTVFPQIGAKFPAGGVGSFLEGKYILSATRIDSNFTDGDVYGLLLDPYPMNVSENSLNQLPGNFSLKQNYPNPFNPNTTILFNLASNSKVTIKVFDLLGRTVALLANNEEMQQGSHSISWNAMDKPSGIYFYQINAGNFADTKKMILLK